jgi:8-amino-7-oxononanoate synthase
MINGHKDVFNICKRYVSADQVKALGVYPYFREIEKVVGSKVICQGRETIMVGSNNYLGLAADPRVIEASQQATKKYGSGCTGSRFLNGTINLHRQLEESLAEFLDREAVIVLSTGFFANQAALTALFETGDAILCDRENHASIIDGCSMSPAKNIPYAHNSADSLSRRLRRLPEDCAKMVVSDGVFSMSGDLVNLPEIAIVAKKYGARIYIDEAHSLGVFGKQGRGSVHHFGMNEQVDLIMGTFSKSLGSMGGFLAGPEYVIDFLKHNARCFMFTASLAPAVTAGVQKALQIMQSEPERIARLWKNTHKMHEGLKSIGYKIGTTQSPIVPILIGSETKAFMISKNLFEAGIFTTPAVYPAVRYGEAIVRTSYMATHTDEELDYVLEVCERLWKEMAVFEEAPYTGDKTRRLNGGYDFTMSDKEGTETLRTDTGEDSSSRSLLRTSLSRKHRKNIRQKQSLS